MRTWTPEDREKCLDVFRTNMPNYFFTAEEDGFAKFLDAPDCEYFVVEDGDEVVACGGFHVNSEEREASMVWGMVRQDRHKRGIGTLLLLGRLQKIAAMPEVTHVHMDTSQFTFKFYERFGFVVESVKKDGYLPGLDRYDMSMAMTEDRRAEFKAFAG
jgi:predicted GNAT family N-acyltransferase